jgi:hypothetical protein
MPRKAENVDFLSKLPGMGWDLSTLQIQNTDLYNLVGVSADDEVGLDMGGFGVRFYQELLSVDVQCDCL